MSFMDQYNISITNTILDDYPLAYEVLKVAKILISNPDEQLLYYQTLVKILLKLNYKKEGYKLCEKVITSRLNWDIKNEFINYQSQFIDPLKNNYSLNLNCPTPEYYNVSSPSILSRDDGYLCNLRLVNYHYQDGNYPVRQQNMPVNTINYMVNLDLNFNIQHMWEMNEVDDLQIYPSYVCGMEDVRLFGPNYFFCTRLDVNNNNVPKICLGIYEDECVIDMKILDYKNMGTEKNWLPIYEYDRCKVIYSFEPLVIYDLNLSTGTLTPFLNEKLNNKDLSSFRGSSAPISYTLNGKNGHLMTIHQVYYHKLRKYLHRLVWLSDDFSILKYSKSFYFEKVGIEFNLGICIHERGILFTYSVDDNHPKIILVDFDTISNMLATNIKQYTL